MEGFRLLLRGPGIDGCIPMNYTFSLTSNRNITPMLAFCWAHRSHYQEQDAGNEAEGLRIVMRVLVSRTFLGIKILGGCLGRFAGCGGRGFCVALPVVGSLRAGGGRLDFVSEDGTASLGGTEETSGVVAGG